MASRCWSADHYGATTTDYLIFGSSCREIPVKKASEKRMLWSKMGKCCVEICMDGRELHAWRYH
jgi:hypothetical protein